MSSFKEKLNSVVFLWIGLALAVVTMIMIAVPAIDFQGVKNSAAVFWDTMGMKGNWPLFVGYMAILVGGILMGVMALSFVQPSALVEKIILITAGVLLIVGIVLLSSSREIFFALNEIPSSMYKIYDPLPGPYIGAGLAGLALIADGVALALDW